MDQLFKPINEILLKLNSTLLHPAKTLGDLTLTPAGYMMLFMHLHLEYKCFPLEYVKSLDLENLTGQAIVDRIDNNL